MGRTDQQGIRRANLSLVLREIVSASQPPTRADVAVATGLTRATVSTLVEWLLERGLVQELSPPSPAKAGRPGTPLAATTGGVTALGAEVNVDYIGARLMDLSGRVLVERIDPGDFRASEPGPVLDRLTRLLATVMAQVPSAGGQFAGGGLAVPGLVDASSGTLRIAPNLGWRDLDLSRDLARRSGALPCPLVIGNEADFAGQAEAHARRAGGPSSFIYVSGEIGVGAAIVLDGQVLRGRHGWSGEIGHSALGTTGSLRRGGTLEQYAGKDAILRAAGLPLSTPVAELARAAADRQPGVRAALARAGAALGVCLANVATVLDVEHVVLGGTFADLAPYLIEPVLQQLRARLISAPWAEPQVHVAVAGPYPALTGAALSAVAHVLADPLRWDARRSAAS